MSTSCVPCGANLISLGSDSDCICAANFFGPNYGPCTQCPYGKSSPPGSLSSTDCFASAGYFGDAIGEAATSCPVGCDQCTNVADCTACRVGYVACGIAAPTTISYCSPTNCSEPFCPAGYSGTPLSGCSICSANSYCPGDGQEHPCIDSISPVSIISQAQCQCTAEYYSLSGFGNCTICPLDHYCPNGISIEACPARRSTFGATGAASNMSCGCLPSWYGDYGLNTCSCKSFLSSC
jgi:hypothetical protein